MKRFSPLNSVFQESTKLHLKKRVKKKEKSLEMKEDKNDSTDEGRTGMEEA